MTMGIPKQASAVNNNGSFDLHTLKKAVLVLRSVNHALRQEIIELIETNGKMTVTEIYVKLRVEQSVASQHLALLRRSGVLETERDGKNIYYSVNKDRISEINHILRELIG
ncbi:MAG: helix-turn-helix transcriptional regulator [Chitinophagales bacterium]|nr:helix-turn-helix transcriptional regulator [Chitinophagales bacterium]